jgi:hypothetical protein
MFSQNGEFRVTLQIALHIPQHTGNISEKFGIPLHPVDVDKSTGGFHIPLDTREIEQTPEGFAIGPDMPMLGQ